MNQNKPKILISKCLEFDSCRYDGQIIHNKFIQKLKNHVDFITICPEVEIGLGTPRDPINLIHEKNKKILYQSNTNKDLTNEMMNFTNNYLKKIKKIDGIILKSKSPSCGIKTTKIFSQNEVSKIVSKEFSTKVYLKNRRILESKLTAIADGRLSKNREKIGIYTNKTNFEASMTVFRMKHELNNDNVASEYFHYTQTLAILPLQRNLSSIVVTLQNDKSKIFLNMTKKKINQKIEHDLKGKLGKMSLIGKKYTYPMLTIYSNEFFRDRCVLIGDAAVGMHPVTAHGFNISLRGINILRNELLNALGDKSDIGKREILEKYEKKFRKVSLPIYLATNAIVRLYTNQKPVFKIARQSLLVLANKIRPLKNAIIDNLLINNS